MRFATFGAKVARVARPLTAEDAPPAVLASAASLALYVWTLAPTVTFKDSGELIVAALHWGVPHPTGYPLWTFLAGLFARLPLGSGAWEVNLFSAVCAALAVGLTTALAHRTLRRWAAADDDRWARGLIAVSAGLTMAVTVTVWSQAVFAEVYTLHVLLAACVWWSLDRWFSEPERPRGVLLCFFLLALGMSNHHLMLALAPMPFVIAGIRRRDLVVELVVWAVAAAAIFYLGFGALADSLLTWETAVRTGQLALVALVALALLRGRLRHWRLGLAIVPVLALGLLPYAYMPLASATNPPMNWGYTRTADGFFYSVNRSPYRGPLSDQLLGTLGRLVDTADEAEPSAAPAPTTERSAVELLTGFALRFADEMSRSFTWVIWPLAVFALWRRRRTPATRDWLLVVVLGFGLSSFFQPASAALAGAAPRLKWDLQMPYLGYAAIPLALLLAAGLQAVREALDRRFRVTHAFWLLAVAALPLVGLSANWQECSQRGRTFAYRFGYDMLTTLPEGAVLFGGSDAGRFVPTFMIFGESAEPPHRRRDPEFDRRDVYLISQTQLLARFYRSYIRDHYGADRPEPGWWGRRLGRDETYPETPLELPSENDVARLIEAIGARKGSIDELSSDIAEWIYRANRERHTFFVEDSVDMPWTRELAIPAGPLYRLADRPTPELERDDVAADHAYWRRTIDELQADPRFEDDLDARLAWMALRHQNARVYRDRGLWADAERGFREALEILPNELRSMLALGELLVRQDRHADARELIEDYVDDADFLADLDARWRTAQRSTSLSNALYAQLWLAPEDPELFQRILSLDGPEPDSRRVVDLAADLKTLVDAPSDVVAPRRVLGSLRADNAHAMADRLTRHLLTEAPSLRLVQLATADQLLQPPRRGPESRAARLELGGLLIGLGEAEIVRRLLRAEERDEEVETRLAAADRLLTTQRDLDPILDRWREGRGLVAGGEAQASGLAARLGALSRLSAAYNRQPTPGRLVQLVEAQRGLRLPERARRQLLAVQETRSLPVLTMAARLAARDVLPNRLLPIAQALEAQQPAAIEAWFALASLRHAANDQEGLQRALVEIQRRGGVQAVLEGFARDPMLAPLAADTRFRRYLFGAPQLATGEDDGDPTG
ncbi:MAG: DUF2723 domain-containing protein [Acidobacteriota bacterium]